MAIYSLSLLTSAQTLNTPCADLKSATAGNAPRLLELTLCLSVAATGALVGVGRSPTVSTQTSPVQLQAENPADAGSQSTCATTWSVPPTAPAQFFRRLSLTVSGQGVIWTFPRGLLLPPNTSVPCWLLAATTSTVLVGWTLDE